MSRKIGSVNKLTRDYESAALFRFGFHTAKRLVPEEIKRENFLYWKIIFSFSDEISEDKKQSASREDGG